MRKKTFFVKFIELLLFFYLI